VTDTSAALTGFAGSILTLPDEMSLRIKRLYAGGFLRGGGRGYGRCRE
jgi:hypothetical protein